MENALITCSAEQIEKQMKSRKGRQIFQTGPQKFFLILPTPLDISKIADRVYTYDLTGKVSTTHKYDDKVDGMALSSEKFVAFFNHALEAKSIALTKEELSLKKALLAAGLIKEENEKMWAPNVFALGFAERRADKGTVGHEMNHMDFETNPTYRKAIGEYYDSLSPKEKNLIRSVLTQVGYANVLTSPVHLHSEFAAFFRDFEVLKNEYGPSLKNVDWSSVQQISEELRRIESKTLKPSAACEAAGKQ